MGLGSGIIYTLVITPVVIQALEREAYGIWSFLNALVAYSTLLYLGLGAALVKYVAEYYAVGDRSALNRLVSVVFSVYTSISLLIFVVGYFAAPHVATQLLTGLDLGRATTVSSTVVILAARLSLMFIGSVFSGVLVAQGRTDLYRAVAVFGHVARLVIVPIAVRGEDPLLALAFVVAATGAIEVLAMMVLALREDPQLRCGIVIPKMSELRLLYGFGLLAFLLQAGDKLISYTDTTVIGLILGPGDVAIYVLPLQLTEYGRLVVFGIVSVMLPHLSALLVTGRRASFRSHYSRVVKMTALVSVYVNMNIVWLGQDFLRIWVGPEFSEPALPLLVALGVAGLAQGIAVQSQTPFCLAMGRLRFAGAVLLAEGLANLTLSVLLAQRFGINGVAVATAVPAVLISGTILPFYVARLVGTPLRDLVRDVALPVGIFMAIVIGAHIALRWALDAHTFLTFAAKFATGTLVATIGGWIVVSDSDRRAVRTLIERKRRALFTASGQR